MKDRNNWENKGAIHIYTGEGKGKTTTAIGLAIRASSAGLKVSFIQFLKGGHYAEHKQLKKNEGIVFQQFGRDEFVIDRPDAEDINEAQAAFLTVQNHSQDNQIDLVIADELCVAVSLGLIKEQDVLALMNQKLRSTELIITGRGATTAMIADADLVTQMKEIKHYYHQGRVAKVGIEY